MIQNLLYDKQFLLKLDKDKNKTIYARITALQFDESPIEYIEGRVTQGSINIDGDSAVRRACSLSIICQDFDYSDYYWSINTKFKLEVGLENHVDNAYPDVIWFNQGIYLITNFNTSHSSSGLNISISGKDKMCLLNGEVGGTLQASIDFGTEESEDSDGIWHIKKIPIPDIIRHMVHTYAGEPYWNIVINDLNTYGVELLEYRYDIPMYLYRNYDSQTYDNAIIENNSTIIYKSNIDGTPNTSKGYKLKDLTSEDLDLLLENSGASKEPKPLFVKQILENGKEEYIPIKIAKMENGHSAGYRETDLIYPGDLIANIGDSITSVLDKIKNMLVEFEYFYDLNGQFVFQKKRSFINSMWTPVSTDEQGNAAVTESLMQSSATAYTFSGGELITAFNNSPNILNMRNDYSVWGEREGITGAKIPIHMRYAIDKKPIYYKSITVDYGTKENPGRDFEIINKYNKKYGTNLKGQESKVYDTNDDWDWREIIYQMASDYYKYNFLEDFELRLIKNNLNHYPSGQTGYEQYYIDIISFWRDLYDPEFEEELKNDKIELTFIQEESNLTNKSKLYWQNEIENIKSQLVLQNNKLQEETNQNSIDRIYGIILNLKAELKEAQNELIILENREKVLEQKIKNSENKSENFYKSTDKYKYWNKKVYEQPEVLNFWFDFLDVEGELSQFSVKNMGVRSKSINDTTIKSIYFRDIPSVMFTSNITQEEWLTGYRYIQVPEKEMDSMFKISSQGKSAKNKIDELLYQHGYCIESVTISAIPIYYLEPNTRIYIYDEKSKIDGDYIASKITIPLSYNGTMSITATKAAETLF